MAHELDFSTGQAAIAYTGQVPWHGYGQQVSEDLPLNEWRRLAGLDFDVEGKTVRFYDGVNYVTFPKKVALIRSDNKQPLSIVSDRYKVVQPKQVLEFFESVIEENGFKMSTAGSLREGRRVWAMADCGEDFKIGEDHVGAHLLLATSYDGTFATTAQFTSIRVVCNNTLGFSLDRGGEGGVVRIPHTSDFNQWDIKTQLGFDVNWQRFQDQVERLTKHSVTKAEAVDYFMTVLNVTKEEVEEGIQVRNMQSLYTLFNTGPGAKLPSAEGTMWGALNAVTHLVDHCRAAKNTGNRFDSASFGGGAALKRRAFKHAVELTAARDLDQWMQP